MLHLWLLPRALENGGKFHCRLDSAWGLIWFSKYAPKTFGFYWLLTQKVELILVRFKSQKPGWMQLGFFAWQSEVDSDSIQESKSGLDPKRILFPKAGVWFSLELAWPKNLWIWFCFGFKTESTFWIGETNFSFFFLFCGWGKSGSKKRKTSKGLALGIHKLFCFNFWFLIVKAKLVLHQQKKWKELVSKSFDL